MNKQRKKTMIILGVTLLLGLLLMLFLVLRTPENVPNESNKVEQQKPEQNDGVNKGEENEETSTENAFVEKNEEAKYYMDGSREKAEVKKEDYTYLFEEQPVTFEPKIPESWKDHKTQIDDIPEFFEKTTEERAVYYEANSELTDEEKAEFEKITAMNAKMYEAYQKGDYNTFLTHMYKNWRESYGIFIGKLINKGEFKERILGFYPEFMDTKIGYAYGYMVREVSYIYNGNVTERRVLDSCVIYKQNDKGEWEVYFEYQLQ